MHFLLPCRSPSDRLSTNTPTVWPRWPGRGPRGTPAHTHRRTRADPKRAADPVAARSTPPPVSLSLRLRLDTQVLSAAGWRGARSWRPVPSRSRQRPFSWSEGTSRVHLFSTFQTFNPQTHRLNEGTVKQKQHKRTTTTQRSLDSPEQCRCADSGTPGKSPPTPELLEPAGGQQTNLSLKFLYKRTQAV